MNFYLTFEKGILLKYIEATAATILLNIFVILYYLMLTNSGRNILLRYLRENPTNAPIIHSIY
jgi:hypothetical protein